MSDSPVFPRLAAVIDVSFPSFVFHSVECAEREKAWAVRLFKLQVPVEKCLSTCLFTRACVRACVHMYIRGCEYTLTAALLRLTSDRTTNANRKTRNRDRDLKIKSDHCRDTFSINLPIYIFLCKFLPASGPFPNKFIRWFDEKRCAITFKLSLLGFLSLYHNVLCLEKHISCVINYNKCLKSIIYFICQKLQ